MYYSYLEMSDFRIAESLCIFNEKPDSNNGDYSAKLYVT